MFSQDDIDAVLSSAQDAVDNLADDVSNLNKPEAEKTVEAQPAPAAPAPASAPTQPPAVFAPAPQPQNAPPPAGNLQRLLNISVPLVVRLANRSMTVNEIMKLSSGSILEFDRRVEEELDLMINNCQIGAGIAVKVDEHFGLRITRIDDIGQRIASLGAP